MENFNIYIPHILSIIALIVSIISVFLNNQTRLRVEQLKINNKLDVLRYNDLKEVLLSSYIEITNDIKKIQDPYTIEKKSNPRKDLIDIYIKNEKVIDLTKNYSFLLSVESKKKMRTHIKSLKKIKNHKNKDSQKFAMLLVTAHLDFTSNMIDYVNEDLRNLIKNIK